MLSQARCGISFTARLSEVFRVVAVTKTVQRFTVEAVETAERDFAADGHLSEARCE